MKILSVIGTILSSIIFLWVFWAFMSWNGHGEPSVVVQMLILAIPAYFLVFSVITLNKNKKK